MKSLCMISTALTLTILGFSSIPLQASEPITTTLPQNTEKIGKTNDLIDSESVPATLQQNTEDSVDKVNRASTSIVVAFPNEIILELGIIQSFSTTLVLVQSVSNSNGEIVAPENSLVQAELTPIENGIQLEGKALLVNGHTIPIQTASITIPAQSVSKQRDPESQESGSYSRLGASLLGAVKKDRFDGIQRGGLFGNAINQVVELTSSDDETKIVHFPQGSIFTLPFQLTQPNL